MSKNPGLLKEDEMVFMFNNKKYKDLSKFGQYLIKEMFGPIKGSKKIKASKTTDYVKPDFYIEYNKQRKYVSMKSGKSQTVHSERINTVIKYLRELGVSERTLKILVTYHFGDGTLDGTGKNRLSYHEIVYKMKDLIKEANEELNKSKLFINACMERFIFNGVVPDAPKADYLYYGDTDFGFLISRKQITTYINKKDWMYLDNLHIGPLLIRPHARYSDKDIVSEFKRHRMCFYWVTLIADLKYINDRFDG